MIRRSARIALFGPARLESPGGVVSMQRKALAVLYLLALDGPTRRERIAGLLWGHDQALRNLRVELHGVNRALERHALPGFPAGQDPLVLPDGIDVDRTQRHDDEIPLEGLEDLSRAFEGWLAGQRARLQSAHVGAVPFGALVDDVAAELRAPAVVVVEGLPLSGRRVFAHALAARLDLPLLDRPSDGVRGLYLVRHDEPYDASLADRIVAEGCGVSVIERSAFGEDSTLLLDLRASLPADRVRYVKLPPLDWHEARTTLLADLPHAEAARVYMATGGMLEYLEEMLELRPETGFGENLPLPRRVAAAFQREARRLPIEARDALERLAVQPGRIADEFLESMCASENLLALERRRWLTYDGGWRWSHEVARRVVYATLRPGQRRAYHQMAAEWARSHGLAEATTYHLWSMDRGDLPRDDRLAALDPLAPGMSSLVHLPEAWTSVEPEDLPPGARWVDDAVWWKQSLCSPGLPVIRIRVPDDRTLLRLRGEVHWEAAVTCEGGPVGLHVALAGSRGTGILLSPYAEAPSLRENALVHPADGRFDVWLLVPSGGLLELDAAGSGFVAAFAVEVAVARRLDGATAEAKEAYELVRDRSEVTPRGLDRRGATIDPRVTN